MMLSMSTDRSQVEAPPGRAAKIGERGRIAISVSGIIGYRGRGDGAQNFGPGSFIGGDLCVQKIGNGDGGDNQDDGHDDEQFDEREAALAVLILFAGLC